MSTQELLAKPEQTVLTINAPTFFGKSLNEVYKFYNIEKEDTYIISSIFFKHLYKTRKANKAFGNDFVELKYKVLKSIIYNLHKVISAYLDREVKHAKVLSFFIKHLMRVSLKNDDMIRIVNLRFFYGKSTIKMLSQLSPIIAKTNNVNKCAIKVLRMLVYRTNKDQMPFELALILLFDAQTIYYIYDRIFDHGTNAYKTHMLGLAILMQLVETPIGTIYYNNENYYLRDNIPKLDDIDFKNAVNNKSDSFSLPYLVDYFGHDAWYKEFTFGSEINETNLFEFKLEDYY